MDYSLIKVIHIVSSTILFGTGLGSAYYKWRADREGNLGAIVFASKNVVLADWVFTTPAIIIQPISGLLMIFSAGYAFTQPWIIGSIVLYIIAGLCWLPVVRLQIQMRDLAIEAYENGGILPDIYHRKARTWFWLGIPAFGAVISVFILMVTKPTF